MAESEKQRAIRMYEELVRERETAWKLLKGLGRRCGEHAKLDELRSEIHMVNKYMNAHAPFQAALQDSDLFALLGLFYIRHHSELLQDLLIPEQLLCAAHAILHHPHGPSLARQFLSDVGQRKIVEDALLSDLFAERQIIDPEVDGFGKHARRVYDTLKAEIPRLPARLSPLLPDYETYPEVSEEELEFLLEGIKSEPVVEELLVPCQMPPHLSHLEKVADATEHARLMLLRAKGNIFYGCNFTYSELGAALEGAPEEKEKLRDSSELLCIWLTSHCVASTWRPRLASSPLCKAHRLIEKISPSPREVYEVLVQSALEGPGSAKRALKRKRSVWCSKSPGNADQEAGTTTSTATDLLRRGIGGGGSSGAADRTLELQIQRQPVKSVSSGDLGDQMRFAAAQAVLWCPDVVPDCGEIVFLTKEQLPEPFASCAVPEDMQPVWRACLVRQIEYMFFVSSGKLSKDQSCDSHINQALVIDTKVKLKTYRTELKETRASASGTWSMRTRRR